MVNFNKRMFAAVAQHSAAFLYHPGLLTQSYGLPRPALHCLIICVLRGGEVADQSNQLVNMLIRIVPSFDLKWQVEFPGPYQGW